MFVVGDTIDGVGVYPGQEKDLVVKDIKEQYKILAEFYKRIPKHISIIQCAGQHDAVRVAEPQPPVGEDFAECLQDIENLYLVSNPSFVEIGGEGVNVVGGEGVGGGKEGIKVLMYHGASMHGMIGEIEELRMNKAHAHPARVIKHILLRRHLAPTHGATTYIPNSSEDPMLISEVPDVITTGDLHRTDIDSYNNVLIVANSCWQAMTAFEEKVGNNPDPCKVPILNLKTRAIKILDFSDVDDRLEDGGGDEGGDGDNVEEVIKDG
jgi:DNA polymerase II small subunit